LRNRGKVVITILVLSNLTLVVAFLIMLMLNLNADGTVLRLPGSVSSSMDVNVFSPALVEVGSDFEIVVAVENTGGENLIIDEILLPNTLLHASVVTRIFPGSLDQSPYENKTGFKIDFILAPEDEREFTLNLTAINAVDFSGDIEVKAGSLQDSVGVRVVIGAEPTQVVQATATEVEVAAEEIPYQSVVKITALYMENGRLEEGWNGSGSIISSDGLILTNAHVVLPDKFFPVDAILVSMTNQPDQLPIDAYYAEVLQADWLLDVAVLRIHEDLNGNVLDRGQLNLPFVPLGDSSEVNLGDSLLIMGYPGIGGGTITLTRGEVSGFTADESYGDRAFIKTSGTIAGGNSGGLVADQFGRLVAIPTQLGYGGEDQYVDCRVIADTNRDGVIDNNDDCVPTGGFINALRPINLAFHMIDASKRGEYLIIEEPRPNIQLPTGRTLVYSEDFSDSSSGWTHDAEIDGFVGYRNGEYQIQVDVERFLFWGLGAKTFSDLVLVVDARVVTPVEDGEIGVICRHRNNENFYGMTVTADGWFSIWKLEDDEFSMLHDWDYSRDIPQYAPLKISAACIGNKLTLAVNDVVLSQVTDYSFTSGDIGLFAGTWEETGLTVAYDNLMVMSP
jgi:S1-C subfamily serine protease